MPLSYPFDPPPPPARLQPVAPGVDWLRMPLPFALDHINLWLLNDGARRIVIDTGFGDTPTREHWRNALAGLPGGARAISAIVVTHFHPDHLGLAAPLAREAEEANDADEGEDVPIYMTHGEALAAQTLWHQVPGHSVADMLALFRAHGLDAERLAALERRGNTYRRGIPELPQRFRRMDDGDELCFGDTRWRVITGAGHSPEHAALYCAERGVLIAGDMVLPRISPNISVSPACPEDDALGRFLTSLQRFRALPEDTLVLPSHGLPFHGLHARVTQLETHHAERCDALVQALPAPASAAELLPVLFPRALDNHQLMFAMGEAIAHLNHLQVRGTVRPVQDDDGVLRYVRAS